LNVVTSDEDDNRVLEAAQAGAADFVVTGDQDLLDLGMFERARIVTAADFFAGFKPDAERAS
jgi:predicted nucleic acid-binding protein